MHRPSFLRTALAALPFLAFLGGEAPPADAPERAPTEPEIPSSPWRARGGTSTKREPSDATSAGRRAIAKRERQAAFRRRQCAPRRAEVSA